MAQLELSPAAMFLSDDDLALVTAAEAGRQLGIDRGTISQWKARELLTVQAWRGRQPLFSLREVVELEHFVRTAGRGFRRGA